jgi:hypothetical protein
MEVTVEKQYTIRTSGDQDWLDANLNPIKMTLKQITTYNKKRVAKDPILKQGFIPCCFVNEEKSYVRITACHK